MLRTRTRSKYGAIRTEVDGISFASKKEARRYSDLQLLARAGEISDLKLQPRFSLVVNGETVCTYVGDFQYRTAAGAVVIEDAKGVETDVFKLKRNLMRACLGIEVVLS